MLDGRSKEHAANVITEVLYAQCDANGNQYVLLDSVMDFHCNVDVAVGHLDQV